MIYNLEIKTHKKKTKVYDTASQLYTFFLNKSFDEYYDLEKEGKENLDFKFMPINLKIKGYDYEQFYEDISDDNFDDYDFGALIDTSDIPPLEVHEDKVK